MSLKNFIMSRLFFKHLGYALALGSGILLMALLGVNIYTRHGQARRVPDFHGLTMEQADSLARKTKVKYIVADSIYTDVVEKGTVTEQNPKAGFRVKKGRNVSLIVNAIRPEMVPMPDLVNIPLRQAVALLESSGLNVGALVYKPDISIDVVLNQRFNGSEITANTDIEKGSAIDLVLGKGLSNQRTSVPNLVGIKYQRARSRIISASLNVGPSIFDNSVVTAKDSSDAFVYQQSPEYLEDATVQLGDEIYLWLTIDSSKLNIDSTLINLPEDINIPAESLEYLEL